MDNWKDIVTFLLGVLNGLILFALIQYQLGASKVITECEVKLPRNQHYELIAVPVERPDDE